jgi:hypothetical protein
MVLGFEHGGSVLRHRADEVEAHRRSGHGRCRNVTRGNCNQKPTRHVGYCRRYSRVCECASWGSRRRSSLAQESASSVESGWRQRVIASGSRLTRSMSVCSPGRSVSPVRLRSRPRAVSTSSDRGDARLLQGAEDARRDFPFLLLALSGSAVRCVGSRAELRASTRNRRSFCGTTSS